MKQSLRYWVAPLFREKGFTGDFPALRRTRGKELDIVELQFNKYGGGFRFNLGVCSAQGITTYWGKYVPPEMITTADEMTRRYFLDPRSISSDAPEKHWFEFEEGNTDQVAKASVLCVEIADRWFLNGEKPVDGRNTVSQSGLLTHWLKRLFARSK